MSPNCPAKAKNGEIRIRPHPPWPAKTNPAPTAAAPNQPAIVPDQVFFGLTAGQNFGPPIRRPAKYPITSDAITTPNSHKMAGVPDSSRSTNSPCPATMIASASAAAATRCSRCVSKNARPTKGNNKNAETDGQPSSKINDMAAIAPKASAVQASAGAVMRASSQIMIAVRAVIITRNDSPPSQISTAPTASITAADNRRGFRSTQRPALPFMR